jgi:hypothetical protein
LCLYNLFWLKKYIFEFFFDLTSFWWCVCRLKMNWIVFVSNSQTVKIIILNVLFSRKKKYCYCLLTIYFLNNNSLRCHPFNRVLCWIVCCDTNCLFVSVLLWQQLNWTGWASATTWFTIQTFFEGHDSGWNESALILRNS